MYPTPNRLGYREKLVAPYEAAMLTSTDPHPQVFAIPGNHDWYDALEGFVATFIEPNAARTAMRARVEVDNRITSTTDERIEKLGERIDALTAEAQTLLEAAQQDSENIRALARIAEIRAENH